MLLPKLKLQPDPHHVFLRRALRIAIVSPLGLFLSWHVLGLPVSSALYTCFAIFSFTVFVDFSGPPRARLLAYLGAIGAGCVGLIFASVATLTTATAMLATVIYSFTVVYLSVLRGYIAGAAAVLMVPFFLAITAKHDWSMVVPNLTGFVLGGVLATASALLLWPVYVSDKLHRAIAQVLDSAADLVHAQSHGERADFATALTAFDTNLAKVRKLFYASLSRPGLATTKQRALMRVVDLLPSLRHATMWRERTGEDENLSQTTLSWHTEHVLRQCARTFGSDTPQHSDAPDLAELDAARDQDRRHTRVIAAQLLASDPAALGPVLGTRFPSRELSALAIMIGRCAEDYVGADQQVRGMGSVEGQTVPVHWQHLSPRQALRINFTPRSIWFRNSVRAAVAYSAAVALVYALGVGHAFWVLLGVLAAMKFDASGTARTSKQLLLGTLVGVVLGVGVVALTQDAPVALWVLLPISVGLAAYTPGAVSLTVGQASFAVFVIVLFGILTPDKFKTAELRLIDVMLGIVVAIAASTMLWPHGAKHLVNTELVKSISLVADTFLISLGLLDRRTSDEQFHRSASAAQAELAKSLENFDLALAQKIPGGLEVDAWVRSHGLATEVVLNADRVRFIALRQEAGVGADAAIDALIASAHAVLAAMTGTVRYLLAESPVAVPAQMSLQETQQALEQYLRTLSNTRSGGLSESDQLETAISLAWSLAAIDHLNVGVAKLAHPSREATSASFV